MIKATRFIIASMCIVLSGLLPYSAQAANDTLTLAVQPVLSPEKTIQAFTPLATYLSKVTGKKVVVKTQVNFLSYWSTVSKTPKYDLVLDAAHFTDYRVKKMDYKILAKIPNGVSYSIITHDENLLLDPLELIGKKVASLGNPSIGAARLNALFTNPSRQPIFIEVGSVQEGVNLLMAKKVFAAILPTPIVSREMGQGKPINVVSTTQQVPHIALSASPDVNPAIRDKIRKALVGAHKTAAGKVMLKGIGFAKFDPASTKIYDGQAKLLKQYWGYSIDTVAKK